MSSDYSLKYDSASHLRVVKFWIALILMGQSWCQAGCSPLQPAHLWVSLWHCEVE